MLINLSFQQHPWHLHGYHVDFVDAGFLLGKGEFASDFDFSSLEKFAFNVSAKVLSRGDSWIVPQYGYVVFRFLADNPGPWMFHCHVEWHMMMAMAMVFSVEPYTSIYAPPSGLSLCGETYGSLNHDGTFGFTMMCVCGGCFFTLFGVLGIIVWMKGKRRLPHKKIVLNSEEHIEMTLTQDQEL